VIEPKGSRLGTRSGIHTLTVACLWTRMRPYPLRKDITREEFDRLVTDLYYRLAAKGIDPSSNLTVEDQDRGEGPRFALFISDTAAQILEIKSN
jgi:hypothetical protein